MASHNERAGFNRRTFVAGMSAAGMMLMNASSVRSYQANARLELGLIGCGGRGNWITKLFDGTGKYRFVACADYFQDRVDATGERLKIDPQRRHTSLAGYKRLLESKLDAVVIETPPYFHPEQAAAAVDAGKHVFLAKPVAVDVPGCLSIAESGKRATAKKLVFLVDFQTRANELYREALRRVRAGDIGKLVMGEAFYPYQGGGRGTPPEDPEQRLRQWYYVLPLSGDFIVEQSIHSLDVATWIANSVPIRARGTGGRSVRPEGSIWDHFAVTYWFPNDFVLSFTCIQSIPGVKDEIRARVFGSEGVIDTDYFGDVWIRGKKPYEGGSTGNLYTTGAQTNIHEFHTSVTQGNCANETVSPSVRSNLTAVMGRMAGYSGGEIIWKEMLDQGEKLELDVAGLKGGTR
ncbi:MAG: Gfo/Idh/MocA family protein [Pirellulaceae bacterium]